MQSFNNRALLNVGIVMVTNWLSGKLGEANVGVVVAITCFLM